MELEFLCTDSNYEELGYLNHIDADIEIGKYGISNNDFELTLSLEDRDESFGVGSLFYCEDTEFGGFVERIKVNTADETITMTGPTFRGALEKEYVQPPNGKEYLELNDEANRCLNKLISDRFDEIYVIDDIDNSSISVKYDIRDINLLEAIEKALATGNAKLDIRHQDDGKVHLKAVKINDLSDTLQYSNDYQIDMTVQTKSRPYNHILALGKGELLERLRINLYLLQEGYTLIGR